MRSIKDKWVLITGASSGIGEALALQLAAKGCHLVLTARSEDKLLRLAGTLRAQCKVQVEVITADLAGPGAAEGLVAEIARRKCQVDILINNAGFGKWTHFLDEDLVTYQEMMQVNMNAMVQLTHLLLPGMLHRRQGGIINIGSTGSFQPCPYIAVYCATKAFVLSFSEALYGEYENKGITVTAVCPGNTQTHFFNRANVQTQGMRFATPGQVAEEAITAFMKGKNCIVTGGFGNYMQSLSSRFLPRKTIIRIVGNMFRSRVPATLR